MTVRSRCWSMLVFIPLLAGFAAPPSAAAPARPDITANLIVGNTDIADPHSIWLGVRVLLGPGWKTYWKSPGDAGLPPEFDWTASSNIKAPEVNWPLPHRTSILGLDTIGYSGEVVFPVKIVRRDPAADTAIVLKLAIYACSNVCVREEYALKATFGPDLAPRAGQQQIVAWLAKVPLPQSPAITVHSITRLGTDPEKLQITASAIAPFASPDVLIDSDPPIVAARPELVLDGDGVATFTVVLPDSTAAGLAERTLNAVVVNGDQAVTASSSRRSAPVAQPEAPTAVSWLALLVIIATALLGGLTLNLMPCVFPVLSLKLMGFVQEDSSDRRRVRAGFAACAAGMIVSFLVLAAALVLMKWAGVSLGWGIQFQQPLFLAAMAIVLALFAASLFDLLSFNLPFGLNNRLAAKAHGTSLGSHFMAGFVATLLATPCSAPFVGTAVGFALARGAPEIFAIFTALGIGMASPYLLVAAFPSMARFIPRPGRWLLLVKRVLAVGLLGTAAWLVTVLGSVGGARPAIAVGGAIVIGLAGLRLARAARPALAAGIAIVAVTLLAWLGPLALSSQTGGQAIAWQSFSKSKVDELVRAGRTVFVDITADWCVTCKVNRLLVIDTAEIAQRLGSDVTPVQGNWTRPDESIARFMRAHGRYGIPFNIVFGPNAPDGIALPELLSTSALIAAFDQAEKVPLASSKPTETTK
ncbi:protein-disulfide reductase DsbD family protein [Rhodopseudomonas sp. P2A-2r]|uniref:protein-disulfide reductase DsbD family protein n=1 Tax=unclassified Rhodopseudomonas TaxID=2638247 RepID=UPI002233F087|nr:protein-disulfide reductase DsbD domain-containing protein [Rhodopseudomonas sp. P2A-2r]UZE46928.1 protein-disulfide reductase DsbD family protein [Rhodopseudomonas sp. P2A-2r]